MPAKPAPFPHEWHLDDLLKHLGDIPASRIRLSPLPGTAVEKDVIRVHAKEDRLCELIDGVLVEKAMGWQESRLAMWIGHLIQLYLDGNDLGMVTGADGMMRLMPGLVRIPDVAFIRHDRLSDPAILRQAIPDLGPDLAVEVLSESNTRAEMRRKTKEYFFAGARLVWLVDPPTRTVSVSTSPDESVTLDEGGTLDGGDVLPGFSLPVARLIEKYPTAEPPRKGRGKKK